MFSRRQVLLAVLSIFGMSCLNAQDDADSQKAKAILQKGQENLKKMNYKSFYIEYNYNGKPEYSYTIYNKSNPDGTTSQRREYDSKNSSYRSVSLINGDDRFEIHGNNAVKENFQRGRREISKQNEKATYSMADDFHRDIPCHLVTKRILPDEESYNNFIKAYAGNKSKTSEELKSLYERDFPVTEVYYIGKDGGFIYKSASYNIRGKRIDETNYGDVELNAALDDRLFDVGKYNIIAAKDLSEYISLCSFPAMLKYLNPRRGLLMKLSSASSLSLADIKASLTPWYFTSSFLPASDAGNTDY